MAYKFALLIAVLAVAIFLMDYKPEFTEADAVAVAIGRARESLTERCSYDPENIIVHAEKSSLEYGEKPYFDIELRFPDWRESTATMRLFVWSKDFPSLRRGDPKIVQDNFDC